MRLQWAAIAVCAALALIYLPDAGHGFVKDDFGWIETSRVARASQLPHVLLANVGFYRPIVSLTFSADYALSGLDPSGYSATNLALFVLDGLLLYGLARRFSLTPGVALVATGIWSLNFHAVNMALLWISGRTALMLCLFALATAHAFLRRRAVLAGVFCLLALLCKEEAVLLPMVCAACSAMATSGAGRVRARTAVADTWPMWVALGVYAVLRAQSGAFLPGNAPSYYRFTFNPFDLLRNVLEYADRAGTVAAATALVFAIGIRRKSPLTDQERRIILFGSIWTVGFFGVTVFLPIRSDLYALTPSVGTALIAAAIIASIQRTAPRRFNQVCAALLVLVFVLIPVYRARNRRWVEPARLSASVLTHLRTVAVNQPRGQFVLLDNGARRFNLDSAFGSLLPVAVHLFVGPDWTAEVKPFSESARVALHADPRVMAFALGEEGLIPVQ